ncbi:peptide deformylase [Salinihabitans flavidus]|uniref:Peptide deformylase n=1 Tax=Salinihabitans flavidus TaxID=569882 RepID=A0A1H8QSX6_9RHOB|nr:peptide deformylase [Salinihabitans flavidus]SEO57078.1 peptide deformylase [Salinihabitans flavidus]
MQILRWPDTRLSTPCTPVADPSALKALTHDMLQTMYEAPGRGLAAPQIGLTQRLFVMDPTWKDSAPTPYVCINPEITSRSDAIVTGQEACLSIPGVAADVPRHAEIILRWQGLDGVWQKERLTGFAAICAQHEYDHLDGIVIFDRVDDSARTALLADYGVLA